MAHSQVISAAGSNRIAPASRLRAACAARVGHHGTFVPTGQVVVYNQSGNDVIQMVPLNLDGSTKSLSAQVLTP
jgi:hypothetical protein